MSKIVTLLLTLTLFACPTWAQESVRLIANTSPPYADQTLPQQGLALELVRHIFAGTSYTPDIAIENWSRAVEGAQLGVYDGLAAAWYSEERNRDLLFSEPYLESELIVLKRRNDPRRYATLDDLSGSRVGLRTDYAYGVDFAAIPGITIVEENHLIQNLLRLQNGSVDLVVGDRRTAYYQLHEYLASSAGELEIAALKLPPVARHVAASRSMAGHEKLIEQFNSALAAARKDGSLEAIVEKWDMRYTVPGITAALSTH